MRASSAGASPTVLIANVWHDDNRGDSAITIGTADLLLAKWPGARVVVAPVSAGAASTRHVRAAHPDVEVWRPLAPEMPQRPGVAGIVLIAWWALRVLGLSIAVIFGHRAALSRRLADVDIVVLVGGSNLFDTGSGCGLSTVRLLQFLLPAIVAEHQGKPVWLLGHTLGPFDSRLGRALARRVLRRAERIVLRERLSLTETERLGLSAEVVADMALIIEPDLSAAVGNVLRSHGLDGRRFAAVTIRQAPYGSHAVDERVIDELAGMIGLLIDRGVVERVAVVVHTSGPTAVEDDSGISRRLVASALMRTGAASVCLVEADLSPRELAALYGEASVVIGERLHSVILALCGGTPALAISYFGVKAPGVMAECGFDDLHVAMDEVDAETLAKLAEPLAEPEQRDEVAERMAKIRADLRAAV